MSRRSSCRNELAALALAIALITTACSAGAVTAAPQASPTPRTGLADRRCRGRHDHFKPSSTTGEAKRTRSG